MAESDPHEALPDLAAVLSRVARSLEAEPDVRQMIEAIVHTAVSTVPGAEHAGVTLIDGEVRSLHNVAASSELAVRINELEYTLGEGPCLDAIAEHHVYRTGHLGAERRWSRFAPAAERLGVTSMLGFRLFTTSRTLGSLDLYSTQREAFGAESVRIGELLAAHAAVAVMGMQRQGQLHAALDTRDVIATAKGILMNREGKNEQDAFAMLVGASQSSNMKLRDVATWLVDNANTAGRQTP